MSENEAKNKAVKEYCDNTEFTTYTDDPKATIYNLRAMAFASGWEACMFHHGVISKIIDPPIKIPEITKVACINCQSNWVSSPGSQFQCLNCGKEIKVKH